MERMMADIKALMQTQALALTQPGAAVRQVRRGVHAA
jgi:hypothetical protein